MRQLGRLGGCASRAAKVVRSEAGFGLIELLVAMVVTSIAVMALVAALSSSHVSLVRAARISTAAAVASAELEKYHALKYSEIELLIPASPTTANVPGADGRQYPTTTTIKKTCPDGADPATPTTCTGGGRPLISVAVLVRELTTNAVLVRESSAFDESTGS
jgi:prepilin-type N-terminal cleavage/methylation domain-containing protein